MSCSIEALMTKGNEVKNRLKEDKDQSSYRVWPEYPLRA